MLELIFRKLPIFRGKHRLARFLFKDKIISNRNIKIRGKYNCEYLLPNIQEPVAFDLFINGIYESDTHRFLLNSIPQNGLLIDIGANIGAVTIPLCKRRADIRAICIEAAPPIFRILEKNILTNGLTNQVSCFAYALFDQDNKKMPFYSPKIEFGKGSLSSVFTDEMIEVETIRLDTLLEKLHILNVDCIKMDIEGFEYYAFKGGEKLLKSPEAPDILFEFADWAEESANNLQKGSAQDILLNWEYNLFKLEHERLSPVATAIRQGSCMIFAKKRTKHP